MTLVSMPLTTLKKRSEFQRIRKGARASTDAFLLEGKRRGSDRVPAAPGDGPYAEAGLSGARFGFTITKKVGNAVVRNRIRRRLKAAIGELDAESMLADADYVVVARKVAATKDFAALKTDFSSCLKRVNRALQQTKRGDKSSDAAKVPR